AEAASQALLYAAPVGEKESHVARLLDMVRPFVEAPAP
ncbi:MAG: AraC family transcriptional regulator, partial [Ideonella sp.]|nr:AraC family transcriptional regulator [Ideonella sp.]